MSDDEQRIEAFGKVIPLNPPQEIRPKGNAPFQLIVNRNSEHCAHVRIEIDPNRRTVVCKPCGAQLDPFEVLLKYAQQYERFSLDLRALKVDLRATRARLEVTKKLEENARARARRLGVRASKDHFEVLLRYAREMLKRPELSAEELERLLEFRDPERQIAAGLGALQKGHSRAALELMRRALDSLEAAVDVVEGENRRHG